jgi:hypothetical protein
VKAYSVILFFLCLNASGLITGALIDRGVLMGSASAMPYTSTDVSSRFSFSIFNISLESIAFGAVGAGLAGIIGLITKQGIFAIYAILIWLVGIFSGVAQWVLGGFGQMIDLLLLGTGLDTLFPAPLSIGLIFNGFMLSFFFFWLASILSQRQEIT